MLIGPGSHAALACQKNRREDSQLHYLGTQDRPRARFHLHVVSLSTRIAMAHTVPFAPRCANREGGEFVNMVDIQSGTGALTSLGYAGHIYARSAAQISYGLGRHARLSFTLTAAVYVRTHSVYMFPFDTCVLDAYFLFLGRRECVTVCALVYSWIC